MTNSKSTKRALFSSALAIFMSFAMLIGITFAWFTDTASTAVNKIQAGTLDVDIVDKKNDSLDGKYLSFKDINDNTDILWEPGATFNLDSFKIVNKGNLAFKYKVIINGVNGNAKLLEAIDFFVKIGDAEKVALADWEGILLPEGKTAINDNEVVGATDLITISGTMKKEAGNEYQGLSIDGIGITVVATQYTYEYDSFGPDYDKGASAFVSSSYELRDAIANVKDGGTVYVNDGTYNIDSQLTIPGKSVNIVGVGENAVIHMTDRRINYNKIFYIYGSADGEDVTVNISNVTLTADIATKSDIWIRTDGPNGEKVNGNVTVNLDNVTCASIICDNNYVDGDTINLKIANSNVKKVALDASPFNGNGLNTYTNLTYNATRIDSITISSSVEDLTHITINGINPSATGEQQTLKYISTAEELAALGGTKINGAYALMADIDMSNTIMTPMEISGGANVTFNGNGYTISNLTLGAANIHGMTGAGNEVAGLFDLTAPATTVYLTVNDLVLENATVACNGYAGVVAGYNSNGGSTITLDNVDVKGATVTAETVAGLVGYTTGVVNMTDCDVSGLALTGEVGRPEKVGALIGTANTADCAVTVANCTNGTTYNYAGRVINKATMTVDGKTYVTNADGLASVVANGATNILLADGEYDVKNCGGKTLTISGSKKAVIKVMNEGESGCDYGFDGSTVTFNGVTFDTSLNNGNYKGFARMKGIYNECTFDGSYALNDNGTFTSCVFNVSGDAYNLWTWGAPEATFTSCTFNSDGKAVLLYGATNTKLTLNTCVFNDNGGLTDLKAAVEIGNDYNKSYELIVNNTVVNGYEINDKGINTGSTLWGNKNSMGTDKLNVVIDGVDVY